MENYQKRNRRKLYLLTETFPYGKGEKSFIMPELPLLLENFEVTIISSAENNVIEDKDSETKLPTDINVIKYTYGNVKGLEVIKYILSYITNKACLREMEDIFKSRQYIIKRLKKSLFFYASADKFRKWLKYSNVIDTNEEAIYYSYWYTHRVLSIILDRKRYPKLKIITRAHGFDLYNERTLSGKRQPFKRYMDKYIDKAVFISKHGYDYYMDRFRSANSDISKYAICRLGTKRQQFEQKASINNPFLIVSCSNTIPVKRVNLIIEGLALIEKCKIKWVHFGDGSDMEKLVEEAQSLIGSKENIKYEFKGYTNNEDVLIYYKKEKPDCFIMTSESEGSPVAMQEAISFGMPIIGTNVGGISEMVDGNGVLLSKNPTTKEIAESIEHIYNLTDVDYVNMRTRSYEIWENDYNRGNNLKKFKEILETLSV